MAQHLTSVIPRVAETYLCRRLVYRNTRTEKMVEVKVPVKTRLPVGDRLITLIAVACQHRGKRVSMLRLLRRSFRNALVRSPIKTPRKKSSSNVQIG